MTSQSKSGVRSVLSHLVNAHLVAGGTASVNRRCIRVAFWERCEAGGTLFSREGVRAAFGRFGSFLEPFGFSETPRRPLEPGFIARFRGP